MFDEFVSATKEMRTNDKRLEDVPESESTSAIVYIDKGNTEEIIESDDDIVDIEAIALQEQHEVDVTEARKDIDDTYITYNDMVDDDDDLFGILDVYKKSDLHFDVHNVSTYRTND
jgi:hypothetical protein